MKEEFPSPISSSQLEEEGVTGKARQEPRQEIMDSLSTAARLLKEAATHEAYAEAGELSDFLLSETDRLESQMEQVELRRAAEQKREQAAELTNRANELKAEFYPELVTPAESHEHGTSLEEAEWIMGHENILGPADVESVFGRRLDVVPPISFSREELLRAKELGQQLILQVNTMRLKEQETDVRITPPHLGNFLKEIYGDKGLVILAQDWPFRLEYQEPRVGWKLVSKGFLGRTTNKNYLEQTERIVEYLAKEIFKGSVIPDEYQEAISEFDRMQGKIAEVISTNKKEAAILLHNLKITQLTRESSVEVMYRIILQSKARGQIPSYVNRVWTRDLNLDSEFAHVSASADSLFFVRGDPPSSHRDWLGLCFSRTK